MNRFYLYRQKIKFVFYKYKIHFLDFHFLDLQKSNLLHCINEICNVINRCNKFSFSLFVIFNQIRIIQNYGRSALGKEKMKQKDAIQINLIQIIMKHCLSFHSERWKLRRKKEVILRVFKISRKNQRKKGIYNMYVVYIHIY